MSRGLSLHIGLNAVDPAHYEGWDGALAGCENDAACMARIATGLQYETTQLLTRQATRAAVTSAISKAAGTLARGDIFLLTYSGHGGQVPDRNGDEDDGMDETWVLYDGQVVDDELHALYTRFKAGVRIVVLSDSCHSGTVTREMYLRAAPVEASLGLRPHAAFRGKALPLNVQQALIRRDAQALDRIQADTKAAVRRSPSATVLLISGCQDNQTSADGDVNGLFTENLLKVWNDGKYQQDYRHFQKAIARRMPPLQQPAYSVVGRANRPFEAQRPFTLAAPAARRTAAGDGH